MPQVARANELIGCERRKFAAMFMGLTSTLSAKIVSKHEVEMVVNIVK